MTFLISESLSALAKCRMTKFLWKTGRPICVAINANKLHLWWRSERGWVISVREERTEIKRKYFLLLRTNLWGFSLDYTVRVLLVYHLPDSRNLAFNAMWESYLLMLGLSTVSCESVSTQAEVSLKCLFSCLNKVTLICAGKTDSVLFRFGMIFLGDFSGASPSSAPHYWRLLSVS